jgi:ABC-2 type transport system ATP-binding protein
MTVRTTPSTETGGPETSSEAPLPVEAMRLTKTYLGDVQAARDISLHANPGEIVGVVGPNGAGKSTTLKMLATLVRPTSGTARICGIPTSDKRKVRPLIGVALQEVGLDPLMTGREHFQVQASINGFRFDQVEDRAAQLIQRFSLGPYVSRHVGAYSGGTQRRLALALALLTDPKVVIFDEPSAGLDPRARQDLWDITRELKATDRTIVFSTQYLEEADALCDRIYLIDQGVIVADGTPESLKREVAEPTLQLVLDRPAEDIGIRSALAALPVDLVDMHGDSVSLKVDESRIKPTQVLKAIEEGGIELKGFKLAPPSLEDVFFHYTKRTIEPEPLEKPSMDLGTRTHRGGGKRWK